MAEATPQAHPAASASAPPCRGRAPSRPAGEGVVSCQFPLTFERLPTPRRGGPVCPPGHASSRDPPTGRHIGRPLQPLMQYPSTPEKERKPHPGRTPPSPSCSAPPAVAVRSDPRAGADGWGRSEHPLAEKARRRCRRAFFLIPLSLRRSFSGGTGSTPRRAGSAPAWSRGWRAPGRRGTHGHSGSSETPPAAARRRPR